MKQKAFTLIELIVAITIFTIFVGIAFGTFLTFYKAQQDAAASRKLIFEADNIVKILTEFTKEEKIESSDTQQITYLNGDKKTSFVWDSDAEIFTIQKFEFNELTQDFVEADGYDEAMKLHTDEIFIEEINFRVFPAKDPYDPANANDDTVQYQPNLKIDMLLRTKSRSGIEKRLHIITTITSRVYQ